MDENRMNPPLPDAGLCDSDREIFQRVWRRVMPEGSRACPIEVEPSPPAPAAVPAPQTAAVGTCVRQEQAAPEMPSTALAVSPPTVEPVQAVSPGRDVPCLGSSSSVYAALLREMIDGEMEDWRIYQALARRINGSGSKVLGSLASDERRHARRLSAAYFLITGERYQPQGQGGSRPAPDLMNGLREQFLQEQRESSAYQGAAEETGDECLSALFLELSEDEALHSQTIRALLEQIS